MKLSEAIALGSTILKPRPGRIVDLTTKDSGCALGMAAVAVDLFKRKGYHLPYDLVRDEWPWLSAMSHMPCNGCPARDFPYQYGNIIAHIFDYHMGLYTYAKNDWTLEKLIDYVKSVEPKEEEETTASENREHQEVHSVAL